MLSNVSGKTCFEETGRRQRLCEINVKNRSHHKLLPAAKCQDKECV